MSWLLLGVLTLFSTPPPIPPDYTIDTKRPIATGYAWQYRSGLMERVARNRGISLARGTRDFVSVPNCAHVGDLVYARIGQRTAWWTVVDCSRTKDLRAQRAKGLIIEASGWEAVHAGWDHYLLDGPGHIKARIYGYKER